jgi:hypothetical protein|tara:strand:- start:318 stop:659 length:342 start_codon:yes stop_codon:yes gene_type:complete
MSGISITFAKPSAYWCSNPGITARGQACNAESYDFPVRLKFIVDPFDPVGFHKSSIEWKGFLLPAWTEAAQQLQEEGARYRLWLRTVRHDPERARSSSRHSRLHLVIADCVVC